MRRLLTLITLLISISVFSQTGTKNFIDQNYIEVTGKAQLEIIPDEIYLTISIHEKDFKNKKIDDIEKMMIERLVKLGIDTDKDLSIKDLASNFKYYWLGKTDIFVSIEYQLLVNDAKIAGKVFIALEEIEISNIEIDRLEHSKIEELRQQVKVDAIVAAKSKAMNLAGAIDQSIGKAIYVEEVQNVSSYVVNSLSGRVAGVNVRGARSKSEAVYIDNLLIEFEKIKIEYAILCRFSLN